ncbi:hypothetical protein JCM8097_002747 [Rhodosporidiobolus ruineniae]
MFASTSSSSSSSSGSGSSSPSSPALSFASSTTYDLLEPLESDLPHLFVVERSLAQPAHHRDHLHFPASSPSSSSAASSSAREKRPRCTMDDPAYGHGLSKPSLLSFPRHHTHAVLCPRHQIVHDPSLALPARDSRSCSSTSSVSSLASFRSTTSTLSCGGSCYSRSSAKSGRSIKSAVSSFFHGHRQA